MLKKFEYFLSPKDKNPKYSIVSSRTAESVSELYSSDTTSLKEEIEKEEKTNLKYSSVNKDIDSFNIKIEDPEFNINYNKKRENHHYFLFKLHVSIILSLIYFISFIIYLPKSPVIVGQEKNIKYLIKNNTSENLNILLNNFYFFSEKKNIDIDNEQFEDNKMKNETSTEPSGYLLELKTDKIFIIRWIIGYIYFLVRIICFLYSDENINNRYFDKNKIGFIQNFSCLLFPLWVFYYDINNNIEYTKIKNEFFNNTTISYYILRAKNFSMIDYIEGIIPTLFYFLISIINSGMEEKFRALFRVNKKKIKKIV